MNKRGQMYILAAVLLCVAIYGVMKVTNRLELPAETNFDFYVENFKGERAYVYDLGFLDKSEDITSERGLLSIFTKFGWGTGIIYIEYKKGAGWTVINYLGRDIFTSDSEGEKLAIPSGDVPAAKLSFDIGKVYIISQSPLSDVGEDAFFRRSLSGDKITIEISGNSYEFDSKEEDKVESIVFQNIDENYVRVERL